jgi:hypothetical protein
MLDPLNPDSLRVAELISIMNLLNFITFYRFLGVPFVQ